MIMDCLRWCWWFQSFEKSVVWELVESVLIGRKLTMLFRFTERTVIVPYVSVEQKS